MSDPDLLAGLLQAPEVTEIIVDGPDRVYAVRHGRLEDVPERFDGAEQLLAAVRALIAPHGAAFDAASPIVNLRLPDGSQLSAVAPPLCAEGPSLIIRKNVGRRVSAEQLVGYGSWTPEIVSFLRACVAAGINILVSGGVASGKTTVMNLLCEMIPPAQRVISVEETRELQFERRRLLALEARRPDALGRGGVGVAELVEQALRMMPERIIVGELRGAEIWPLLSAMNTGHSGSMALLHATSPRDALGRLEIMATSAEPSTPLLNVRAQLASAFDLIVQVNRLAGGERRVTHLTEVAGMEREALALRDIVRYEQSEDGAGRFVATGHRPTTFLERFAHKGVAMPEELFG